VRDVRSGLRGYPTAEAYEQREVKDRGSDASVGSTLERFAPLVAARLAGLEPPPSWSSQSKVGTSSGRGAVGAGGQLDHRLP
jgi:hypothetical protein